MINSRPSMNNNRCSSAHSVKIIYFILIAIICSPVCHPGAWAKDFLVAIDMGHSPDQPGAISARGVGEYFFNKRIAEGVHARIMAQKNQIKSFLINSRDESVPLAARPMIAAQKKADLLLSIHHDSVHPEYISFWQVQGQKQHYCDLFKGFSLYFSEKNSDPYNSLLIAMFLGSEMLKNKFTPTLHHVEYMKGEHKGLVDPERGIYKYNNLKVLKNATMPAVLMECGVIVNRGEELELCKSEYQEKIIKAITQAIKIYWECKNNSAAKN
jgi:N-acetylmuramoyl-L-alanine amidase